MKMRRLPTWREMHMDTSPAIEAMQFQFYREAPAWRKIALMSSLSNTVRFLALQGLRKRHPQATAHELDLLLLERFHGPLIARQFQEALAQQRSVPDETAKVD
jgi:hypothetical protein